VRPEYARRIYRVAEDLDRPLVFGGPRAQRGEVFNSLYLLRPGTKDFVTTYDKRRLVPLAESHFAAGISAAPFRLRGDGMTVAPLLCFEALFPDLAARVDADLLLNPTNDVRVGNGAGQQAAMAVFRAVENGIPLLRVANRGPSLLVDGRGRILGRARGWGSAIWLVPDRLPSTPYRRLVRSLGAVLPARAAAEGPLGWACLSWLVAGAVRPRPRPAN
jgi:apolipoprotein N-acyltransferase